MTIPHNIIGWIEVPVMNMERAMKFYQEVLGLELSRNQMGQLDMAWFPWVDGTSGSGGSLVYHKEYYKPSVDGVLIYFTAFSGDLANELGRVEAAGGIIMQPKTEISKDHGFMAIILDTEGNRIALHSKE